MIVPRRYYNISTILVVILTSISLLPLPTQGGVTKIAKEFKNKIDSAPKGSTWTILAIFKNDEKKLEEIDVYVKGLNFSEENEHMRTYETVIREEQYAEETQGKVIEAVKKFQKTNPLRKEVKWDVLRGMNYLAVWNTPKDLLYLLGEDEKQEFENLTRIEEEMTYDLDKPEVGEKPEGLPEERSADKFAPLQETWGIDKIGARAWWSKYFNGSGVIIGHIDTGVDSRHPSLKWNWVGKGEGWLDPSAAGATNTFPYESDKVNSHGTHTLGILAGRKKEDEMGYFGVGVAPGARWSSCQACDELQCYGALVVKCGIFFECPNKKNKCRYKPDIVSMSNGIKQNRTYTPLSSGGKSGYQGLTRRLKKAGIIPVVAAGNQGEQGCQTVCEPENEDIINVGNTQMDDTLHPSSSMGPPLWRYKEDEIKNRTIIKPDFVAPGTNIYSTVYTGIAGKFEFDYKTGTSMATPHVAGLIALLLSRTRGLSYKQIKDLLVEHANFDKVKSTTPGLQCGNYSERERPNHKFGWGRVYLPPPDELDNLKYPVKRPVRKMPPPPDYSTLDDNSTLPKVRAWMGGVVMGMAGMIFLMNFELET